MKIKAYKNQKRLILALSVVIVILGAASATAYYKNIWPFAKKTTDNANVNLQPATNEQKSNGNQTKQTNANTDNKAGSGSDQPPAPVPQPDGKSKVNVSITAANQNGNTLQIRALIEVVDTSGTCTLTLSKAGANNVVKTADVQALASSSTCKGFDVPTSELSPGTWNAQIAFSSGSLEGEASTTVDIK